jgi:hypothetical protein
MHTQENHRPTPEFTPLPRARLDSAFAHHLGDEIQRMAQREVRPRRRLTWPWQRRAADVEWLVRLLQQTLVAVRPRPEFVHTLYGQLDVDAAQLTVARQPTWRRWLVMGSLVGSVLSLLGLLAALFFRRRDGQVNKEATGAA